MSEYPPIHPGEILQEEFLAPLGISQYRLAQDIGAPAIGAIFPEAPKLPGRLQTRYQRRVKMVSKGS